MLEGQKRNRPLKFLMMRKKIEYHSLYDIVRVVEKWNIPPDLVTNFDQTSSKLVPAGRSILKFYIIANFTTACSSDKRTINSTFNISLSGHFLPAHLIYGGKTTETLPNNKFSKSFSFSLNPTHYSNSQESIKFLERTLMPYFTKERQDLGLTVHQKALIIFNAFIGQMTTKIKEFKVNCN